jgi:hypothetical protein
MSNIFEYNKEILLHKSVKVTIEEHKFNVHIYLIKKMRFSKNTIFIQKF